MKIFGGINKIIFMIIGVSLMTDAYGEGDLQLGWKGYWPGIVGDSTSTAPPPIQAAPAPIPAQSMPVMSVAPPQPIAQPVTVADHEYEEPAPKRIKHSPVHESHPNLIPNAQPVPQPAIATPAAPVAAAPQSAGDNAALAGIGAAITALGAIGASSQNNGSSRLNSQMMMPHTATEHFNCVGKPPQQCQQEWDNLIQRIESMPGVRIISKMYGCGPNAPGMMQTGPYHPGVSYPMGGYPNQQPYGGMEGYPSSGMVGQPVYGNGNAMIPSHGLTGLFHR